MSMIKSHESVAMSILQCFKHVPAKPEYATDEQLPEPNGSLSKSMPTKAIKL